MQVSAATGLTPEFTPEFTPAQCTYVQTRKRVRRNKTSSCFDNLLQLMGPRKRAKKAGPRKQAQEAPGKSRLKTCPSLGGRGLWANLQWLLQ
jgi:hypothetical protein